MALWLTSLRTLGEDISREQAAISYVVSGQNSDGLWPSCPFYTGVNPKRDQKFFGGSSALTTACCVETLAHVQKIISESVSPGRDTEVFYEQVMTAVTKRIGQLPPDIRKEGLKMVTKIRQMDKDRQIVLLPRTFSACVKDHVAPKLVRELSVANVFGWIAYTVYDNVLDDEGKPAMLPIANLSLREVTRIYSGLFAGDRQFQKIFQEIMDGLDGANTWEVSHARATVVKGQIQIGQSPLVDFGNYHMLAEKSLGHALGPIAIVYSLGHTAASGEVKHLLEFFKNFLIAKQLNDDAHDVFVDLAMGHLTVPSVLLLSQYAVQFKQKTVAVNSYRLQHWFWQHTIEDVTSDVNTYCRKARQALTKMTVLTSSEPFVGLIRPLEKAAEQALTQRAQARQFLAAY
jgi:hypothetical protein